MQKKLFPVQIKGMQQDMSPAIPTNGYAYELKNIRINSNKSNATLSICNEIGNTKVTLIDEDTSNEVELRGINIGTFVIGEYAVLFNTGDKDYIYRLKESNVSDTLLVKILYEGDLNFNVNNTIEAVTSIESDTVYKIYWVDGLNQLRFVNILSQKIPPFFDVLPPVNSNINVKIAKITTKGIFPSGIIQYAISYYNKYGTETPLIYISSINYLANSRGISPEDSFNGSFKIELSDLDTTFDCIKIYSIIRTSEGNPITKVIYDAPISNYVTVIDDGTKGYDIDYNVVQFLDRDKIIPSTITTKDNTLFLGNIKNITRKLDTSLKNKVKKCTITTAYKSYDTDNLWGFNREGGTLDNNNITTFKYGEKYRIGVQFLTKEGITSEVTYINDVIQDKPQHNNELAIFTANLKSVEADILNAGYVSARLVMDVTTPKSIVAQGVLCPTVFKLSDRANNTPFSQSSWIMRSGTHFSPLESSDTINGEIQSQYNPGPLGIVPLPEEKAFVVKPYIFAPANPETRIYKFGYQLTINSRTEDKLSENCYSNHYYGYVDIVNQLKKDIPVKYYNNIPSQSSWENSAALSSTIWINGTMHSNIQDNINKLLASSGNNYYIDTNILTFHSPDIENNTYNITNNTKLRIIGAVYQTDSTANYAIIAGNLKNPLRVGEIKRNIKNLNSNLLWNDDSPNGDNAVYATYMWHRKGSLNGDDRSTADYTRKSELNTKIFLNAREFRDSYYSSNYITLPLNDIQVFNQDFVYPIINKKSDRVYYGNVDSIISANVTQGYSGYPIYGKIVNTNDIIYDTIHSYTQLGTGTDPIQMKYKSTPHVVLTLDNYQLLPSDSGYTVSDCNIWKAEENNSFILEFKYWAKTLPNPSKEQCEQLGIKKGDYIYNEEYGLINEYIGNGYYNSLSAVNGNYLYDGYIWKGEVNTVDLEGLPLDRLDLTKERIYYSEFTSKALPDMAKGGTFKLYLAELYNDVSYPDDLEERLKEGKWIPIGNFTNDFSSVIGDRGDTFYQKWDCLKTCPFTSEDSNQVIDITSFMVESYINVDGRYDTRPYIDLTINNTNFNIINNTYSLKNDIISYNIIDEPTVNFPNQVIFSLSKTPLEDVDAYTKIISTNVVDLNTSLGDITSLKVFNSDIISFQKRGIGRILFNSRVQVNTSDSLPIEIKNSGKQDGYVVISNSIGCQNKSSICITENGIYFIDDFLKDIFILNGNNISNLSISKGMHSYICNNYEDSIYSPYNNGTITLYDKNLGDIYFTNSDVALAYNENLKEFTSLYSYNNVKGLFTIKNVSYQISADGKIWSMRTSSLYSTFFGKDEEYYITFMANPEFQFDKIFDTVEFRTNGIEHFTNWEADSYPFNSLVTTNEYQASISTTKSLKKKFRTWRWQIGRNNSFGKFKRDRIRNPWAKIEMTGNSKDEVRLYDIAVTYYT